MPLPDAADYELSIRNWRKLVTDPELLAGEPFFDQRGHLWMSSGAFATVFRFTLANGEACAVRCFTREQPALQERYRRISEHLRPAAPASFVPFAFVPDGIRVAGGGALVSLPLVKMTWARGRHLHEHLADLLDGGDAGALADLEDRWLELLDDLGRHQLAHGDLHPENILVADDGRLSLVDYDNLFVPSLAGTPGVVGGLPSFLHPRRSPADYGPAMDRFSGWVLLLTLRALRRAPELWARHYEDERKLLFAPEDFRRPDDTPLWRDLRGLPDAELQAWLDAFATACRRPPAATPTLPARPNRRLRDAFVRALSAGHDSLARVLWREGARELPELAAYADRVADADRPRLAPPGQDAWAQFLRARSRQDARAMLLLWPLVRERPEAGAFTDMVRRLELRLPRPAPAGPALEPLAALARAMAAGDAPQALLLWEQVKENPFARRHAARVAALRDAWQSWPERQDDGTR